jgi:exodeoxyribonuclease V gamma subunit
LAPASLEVEGFAQKYLHIRVDSAPAAIAIFGISALPPVYLELYVLMAKFCDITLYFLSPSEGYWGDLQDSKRKSQQVLKTGEEAYFLDTGHPLLASLGKQGQEFFEQIQGCEHESESIFSSPEKKHLLGYIQRDIYDLYDPSLSGQKRLIYEADNSIQIHDSHSALREVEILHDQLLALFDRHSDLAPADVVVMTPDIDVYAGSIDAVFGCASQSQFIPYGISGASGQQQSPLLSAFNQLLDLPVSRFEVDSIISLLECEAIQNRFSFDQTALDLVRKWCRETKIHWAHSSEDKLAMGLPASEVHTWRAGLDRLLLGYAMPLSNDKGQWTLFDDKLAFDGVSGSSIRRKILWEYCLPLPIESGAVIVFKLSSFFTFSSCEKSIAKFKQKKKNKKMLDFTFYFV